MVNSLRFSIVGNVQAPCRAHEHDAGIDFFVPNDFVETYIYPNDGIKIPTGVKVNIPEGTALMAFNKSGVATKHGLIKGAELADCGYQGELHIHVINTSNKLVKISPGMKIIQFVLVPILTPALEQVPENELFAAKSERGEGGFGSTGTMASERGTVENVLGLA